VYCRKQPTINPDSMVCKCGKDAADGYTVLEFPKYAHLKPKAVRMCVKCYEHYLRQDWSKYKGSISSATKGYYV
jgi:hypothetical protein